METESLPDFDAFAVRQADPRFRSPGIMRKQLGKEAVAAYSVRKSRRAKSTEPVALDPNDPFAKKQQKEATQAEESTDDCSKRWSMNAKTQENMSKAELINSYRLLMNEKLRLERFLSIMSKNHEMARNRLESDLLDAMMCIEDLKQALELRMARRRKIDPREAEERRYLIRQNKKLLNQLYESAKKIERLELTKVEMKEQLELLDFQILEVENQKAMMEEELRKLPSYNHIETQTDDKEYSPSHLIQNLQEKLGELQSELNSQRAEAASALARQHHLENLVRELRRDNVDLRDQVAKLDDAENSLAESDKPLAAGTRALQSQLDTQLERVRELESKLNASRDYSDELEARLQTMEMFKRSTGTAITPQATNDENRQAAMHNAMESSGFANGLRAPRVDDMLLQETIRTFHTLLEERDQELVQLKRYIRANQDKGDISSLELPDLLESSVQTDLHMEQAEKLSQMAGTVAAGGLLLTSEQSAILKAELSHCLNTMSNSSPNIIDRNSNAQLISFGDLLETIQQINQLAGDIHHKQPVSEAPYQQLTAEDTKLQLTEEVTNEENAGVNSSNNSSLPGQPNFSNEHYGALHSSDAVRPSSAPVDSSSRKSSTESNSKTPKHYSSQLQELRDATDLEVAKAHLTVSERRRQELERQLLEITDDLARSRTEARASETSLAAARRTEAALRRRLLAAMDIQGSDADGPSNRHSLGLGLNGILDTRDNMELQTALIKAEATNASLMEAAQLDRTRIHDQTMRIGQLEAEHRALMDRLSVLQANETSAQRGIVRLQALYEDMLREYSEARLQDFTLRTRERSRSNFRNATANGTEKKGNLTEKQGGGTASSTSIVKLQKQITALEEENQSLKLAVKGAEESRNSVALPSGRCNAPACIEVRKLLKAFQDRFADVMGQLTRTQQCLEMVQTNGGHELDAVLQATPNTGLELIKSVQMRFNNLGDLLNNSELSFSELELPKFRNSVTNCLDSLTHLKRWLQVYIRNTDSEIAQLRSSIVEMQLASMGSQHTLVTTCTNGNDTHPFSCSISLNKKLDMDLLQKHEQEVLQLRSRVRDLESELELVLPHYR